MEEQTLFTVRFDERTKQVLCAVLDNAITQTSALITAGDYDEALLTQHEELVQVKRGILYTRPDAPKEEDATDAPTEGVEESPVDMYKSQDRPQ